MAENIYSKGTRVWFPDKELGWISAEVTSASRTDDAVKLVFTDERGKVPPLAQPALALCSPSSLSQEIKIDTTVKAIKDGKEGLPPLRNPPLLETADDLATLSHLNEPSGSFTNVSILFKAPSWPDHDFRASSSPSYNPQSLRST